MPFIQIHLTLLAVVSFTLLAPIYLNAHQGATGVVKERMDAMKSMGDDMKVLGAMLKGETAYDPVRVKGIARAVAKHGGDAMTQLFPEGSTQHPSEALPAIWSDWSRFQTLAEEMQDLAEKLETAAAIGSTSAPPKDVLQLTRALGKSCKACHDDFRQRQQ